MEVLRVHSTSNEVAEDVGSSSLVEVLINKLV